jgi:hypothetical protein
LFLWITDLKILATELCANIQFCVLLHRSPSETLEMLGEACGKETQVYEWHKYSSDGSVSVSGDPHCQLSTTNDKNIECMCSDQQKSISGDIGGSRFISWKHLQCS